MDEKNAPSANDGQISNILHSKPKGYSNNREKYFFKSAIRKKKVDANAMDYNNFFDAKIWRQKGRQKTK